MEIDYIADVLLFLFEGYLIMHRIKFYGLFNENVKEVMQYPRMPLMNYITYMYLIFNPLSCTP